MNEERNIIKRLLAIEAFSFIIVCILEEDPPLKFQIHNVICVSKPQHQQHLYIGGLYFSMEDGLLDVVVTMSVCRKHMIFYTMRDRMNPNVCGCVSLRRNYA